MPIGIFDSGVGGLTILSEVKKLLPYESFIYVADQKYIPYGSKSPLVVKERARKITEFLVSKQVKLIIVACNTATVTSISSLRKQFDIPLIGVAPVIKTASQKTKTKKVAVFATPATVRSVYLQELIKKYGNGSIVCKDGATGLENLIDKGVVSGERIEEILQRHLLPLKKGGVDVIALGCTHYPFLKKRMQEILGQDILILDSGGAVARQTKRVLEANNALSPAKKGEDWYYTSGDKKTFQEVVKKLLKKNVYAKSIDL